jgi:excisionase family DNA binding protein
MDMRPLYVRLPSAAAEKLDRAAFELKTTKQNLVAELVEAHLPLASTRRVVVESMDDALTVGHHSFVPADALDVLTLADAAELLRIDEQTVAKAAERGELPGRKLGGEWRFARSAVLRWLAGAGEEED